MIIIMITQQQRIMLIYLWFISDNRRLVFLKRTERFFSSTWLKSDTKFTAHLDKIKHCNKNTSYSCQQADHVTAAGRVTDAHALVITASVQHRVSWRGSRKGKTNTDQDPLSLIRQRSEQSDLNVSCFLKTKSSWFSCVSIHCCAIFPWSFVRVQQGNGD